eukprot:g3215.t1
MAPKSCVKKIASKNSTSNMVRRLMLLASTATSLLAGAFPAAFPHERLPTDGVFQLKSCAGVPKAVDAKGALAFMFLDADSSFSQRQYTHFAHLAKIFPQIHFVAVLSFGLGWDPTACDKVACTVIEQPEGSPASLLLDHRQFYGNQYAFEFFSVSPNELVLYNEKRRFRFLPKTQSDMSRPIGHTWVHTALAEMQRVIDDNSLEKSFMQPTFVEYPQFMVEDGEIGRINAASSKTRCEEKCVQIGCTAFVMYGQHHCTFFAGESAAVQDMRIRYSNANLFVRRPVDDVNRSTKILQGFLWAAIIIFGASMLFFVCQKMGNKKVQANVLDTLEANTGLSSLIRAAEQEGEEETFTNVEKTEDPAE